MVTTVTGAEEVRTPTEVSTEVATLTGTEVATTGTEVTPAAVDEELE